MTARCLHLVACLCSIGLLLLMGAPGIGFCAPERITLYPQGALVRAEQTLKPVEPNRVELSLPIHARRDSLRFEVSQPAEAGIADVLLKKVRRVDSQAVQELQEKLSELRSRKTALESRKNAASAAAEFWQAQSQARPEDVEQTERLAGLIRSKLEALFSEVAELDTNIEELQEKIAELKERLDKLTGQAEQEWLASLVLRKAGAKEVTLSYTYQAKNCGWTPIYRLNALPAESEVEFTWQAKVWQETGSPWREADLELATARGRQRIEPPPLGDWVIRPRPSTDAIRSSDKAMSLAGAKPRAEAAAPPKRREGYRFDTFELGRLSLASGETKRVTLREKLYAAEFDHLVRPQRSEQAFLRARLDLGEDVRLPQGQALFLLESAFLDKRPFSLFSSSKPVFFGPDPELQVSLETVDKKSGQKGLFDKKKSYAWFWRVQISNGKEVPVTVRVEDAAPQIRDERIELTRHFPGPEPTMEEHRAVWELEIPVGRIQSLEYGYSIEYPEDMDLFMGGR